MTSPFPLQPRHTPVMHAKHVQTLASLREVMMIKVAVEWSISPDPNDS